MSRSLLAALLLLLVSGSGAALSLHTGNNTADRTFEPAVVTSPPADTIDIPNPAPAPAHQDIQRKPQQLPAEILSQELSELPSRPYLEPREAPSNDGAVRQPRQLPEWTRVTPVSWAPVRLVIAEIGLDARVVGVGQTEAGAMATPSDYGDVGWYRFGALPGEPGRAVLAGHVDSKSGPAVFFRLRELQPGAAIDVTLGTDGQTVRYFVREATQYPEDGAPLDRIFGASEQSELILITCAGEFDRSRGAYDERLVVYAELAPSTAP